jgi:hypothetical protein
MSAPTRDQLQAFMLRLPAGPEVYPGQNGDDAVLAWDYVAAIVRDATLDEVQSAIKRVSDDAAAGAYSDDPGRCLDDIDAAVLAMKGGNNAK